MTFVVFSNLGKIPDVKEKFIILVSDPLRLSTHDIRSLTGI